MPSSAKTKTRATPKPATATNPVTRAPVRPRGRRQARAVQRALERRRRSATLAATAAAILIVGAFALVLTGHSPFPASHPSAAKATSNCPAPTATPVGPAPSLTAPATPPPVQGKVVNGEQGLQYIDLKAGCGTPIKSGDTVSVLYSGWLQSNGKLFDSSYLHGGTPFSVTVGQGQVIKGWDLGLVGMKLYGERRLIIPAAIAYGSSGQPPTIPANATLIFDVTIASIG
jgi:murein DD-endopeptidase MepM/ murein hydrolase activator NlpD